MYTKIHILKKNSIKSTHNLNLFHVHFGINVKFKFEIPI